LEDKPIRARRPTLIHRARKWARRHKPVIATAAVFGVLVLVLAVLGLLISNFLITNEKNQKEAALGEKLKALAAAEANEKAATEKEQIAKKEKDRAQEQERIARHRFYAAQMNLAQQAWQAGYKARVLELLESQRPKFDEEDPRGFEWYYLWRLCHQGLRFRLRGHHFQVRCLAFSPDGKTLVSGAETVKLWDMATGQERATLNAAENLVWSLAFSPDGKTLATGNYDAIVKLWDVATCQERAALKEPGADRGVAFSPDGTLLALGLANTVTLLDSRTWQKKAAIDFTLHEQGGGGGVITLAFSPDGKAIAAGLGDHTARLVTFDGQTIRESARFMTEAWGPRVAFSPDGKTLAIGTSPLKLWHVATGTVRASFPGCVEVQSMGCGHWNGAG
jgi:hypothetical protein